MPRRAADELTLEVITFSTVLFGFVFRLVGWLAPVPRSSAPTPGFPPGLMFPVSRLVRCSSGEARGRAPPAPGGPEPPHGKEQPSWQALRACCGACDPSISR